MLQLLSCSVTDAARHRCYPSVVCFRSASFPDHMEHRLPGALTSDHAVAPSQSCSNIKEPVKTLFLSAPVLLFLETMFEGELEIYNAHIMEQTTRNQQVCRCGYCVCWEGVGFHNLKVTTMEL